MRFLGDGAIYERCRSEALSRPNPADLSEQERLALWVYSKDDENWGEAINGQLWNNGTTRQAEIIIELLSDTLQKLLPYRGIVYRVLQVADLDGFLARYDLGTVCTWPAFTSSTPLLERALEHIEESNILFTISSQSGRILGVYADNLDVNEVLFDAGKTYKVVAVERRAASVVIQLEEIDL